MWTRILEVAAGFIILGILTYFGNKIIHVDNLETRLTKLEDKNDKLDKIMASIGSLETRLATLEKKNNNLYEVKQQVDNEKKDLDGFYQKMLDQFESLAKDIYTTERGQR